MQCIEKWLTLHICCRLVYIHSAGLRGHRACDTKTAGKHSEEMAWLADFQWWRNHWHSLATRSQCKHSVLRWETNISKKDEDDKEEEEEDEDKEEDEEKEEKEDEDKEE